MRGATDTRKQGVFFVDISIHAPHAGCDSPQVGLHGRPRSISIHAPHAGCDVAERGDLRLLQKFQSTHPMRGATHRQIPRSACARDFNPRTPCGVRPCRVQRVYLHGQFQSTHPMRGATYRKTDNLCTTKDISIHAPHAGCDVDRRPLFLGESISIHAPHAGCDFTRSR